MVAQSAVDFLSLDRLFFLVAGLPPHKLHRQLSPPGIRSEMVRAAVAGNPSFAVSEAEFRREGPSYTVDTLRYFRDVYPGADLFFILGADQLAEFEDWKEPEEIVKLASLAAFGRNGVAPDQLTLGGSPEGGNTWNRWGIETISLPVVRMDISSTDIRARVRTGRSIRYLVLEDVRRIIETRCLYRPKS
jgi:nicotinate-nucleotide adenylyltransferase